MKDICTESLPIDDIEKNFNLIKNALITQKHLNKELHGTPLEREQVPTSEGWPRQSAAARSCLLNRPLKPQLQTSKSTLQLPKINYAALF